MNQARLRELLRYNYATGEFTWRVRTSNRIVVGAVAGCINQQNYVLIRLDGTLYKAHRLAWLYAFNVWPSKGVDHIDGNPANNRLNNLREATQSENMQNVRKPQKNNRSGVPGVFKTSTAWIAYINIARRRKHLGSFANKADAVAARKRAEKELHPFKVSA